MSYTYSDSAMMIATQVAYLNFDGSITNVGDLVESILTTYGVQDSDGSWTVKPNLSTAETEQFNTANNILTLTSNTGGTDEWKSWRVVDVCNDQNASGYYGMLIDTGDGNAIIGCRGSESTDVATGLKDWGEADLGLLDSTLTSQQAVAEAYMEELWRKYGDKYNSFSLTGHSLGGNLAMHMTITAPEEMRGSIERCLSYDGPGFSEEYIQAHRDEIERASGSIDHYTWSWVGSLLNSLPGVEDVIIEATDDPGEEGIWALLYRHATYNVIFNEDGTVREGEESVLATVTGPFSRWLDSVNLLELAISSPNLARAVIGIKLIALALNQFENIKNQCIELGRQVYYNYIVPQVSGDYEIHLAAVSDMAQEIATVESRLQAISADMETLRRNLKYTSATGAYYRSRLYVLRTGLENDLRKLRKMGEVADSAVAKYNSVDEQAASYFSVGASY